jgi:acetolactate synthase-1/2/3 large subunit
VFANRQYQILKNEFGAVGAGRPGTNALSMLDIDNPTLDFVSLAKGLGVSGKKVLTADDLCHEIDRGLATPGPYLIEVQL